MATEPPLDSVQDESKQAAQKCKRCKENNSVVLVRQENLCSDCFDKYVRSKCLKRMEHCRVNYPPIPPRLLLLPISFGVSSTSLLHLLSAQLARQTSQAGRTGFTLLIVYINETSIDPSAPPPSHLSALQSRFPDAGRYVSVDLADIYDFGAVEVDAVVGKTAALQAMLAALPSTTSRMDILLQLRTRLIVALAKREGCEAVLWGDTTTRLAEKTLSETAKGRGFSIPWQMADGDSPFGIKFHYPVSDLLKSELINYATLTLPGSPGPLLPLCAAYSQRPKHSAARAASGRNITIDELMTQYFETIETQYPSIVANVVKTAGKLHPLRGSGDGECCRICGLPGDGAGGDMTLSALTLNARAGSKSERSGMCYGCARSMYGAASHEWPLDP